jgi:cold shock CspA family protein
MTPAFSEKEQSMSKIFHGTVKMYRAENGWGFIEIDGDMGTIFVHRTALTGGVVQLVGGQRVSFTEGVSPRSGKTQAENVQLLNAPLRTAPRFGDAVDELPDFISR